MADNVKITIQESAENVVVRVTQQVDNVKITIGSGSGGGVVTELDPVFLASPAATITLLQISNWDDAYSWGDHALAGYLTSETDPVFLASAAAGITLTDITNWNTAYGWGDHSSAGYLDEGGADSLYLRLDTANSPLTGYLYSDAGAEFKVNLEVYPYTSTNEGVLITANTYAAFVNAYIPNKEVFSGFDDLLLRSGFYYLEPGYSFIIGNDSINDVNGIRLEHTLVNYTGVVQTIFNIPYATLPGSSTGFITYSIVSGNNAELFVGTTSLGASLINNGGNFNIFSTISDSDLLVGLSGEEFRNISFQSNNSFYATSPTINFFSQNDFYVSASSFLLLSSFDINLTWSGILELNGVDISQIETVVLGSQADRIPVSGVIKAYVDSTVSGAGYVPTSRTLTINGVAQNLSANRTWSVGTLTGTGISGRVGIWNGTSSLSTDELYWDFTNNRLGVNVASPAWALDVSGDINLTAEIRMASGAAIRFGGSQAFSGNPTAGNNLITIGGHASYTAVTILPNALGVGIAGPYVVGDSITAAARINAIGGFLSMSTLGIFGIDNRRNTFISYSADTLASNRDLVIGNATYNRLELDVPYIGINTTPSNIPLDILHDLSAGANSTGFQLKTSTGTVYFRIQNGTSDVAPVPNISGISSIISLYGAGSASNGMSFTITGTGQSFSFRNSTSVVATISTSGRLALNTTALPTRVLEVNGDSSFTDDLFLSAGAVIVQTAKKQTHTISGATFYSGGGDDGGAFTGDYSMWLGDEAAIGFTQIGTYPVNTGYGYGVFNGSKLANAAAFGAGAARGVVDMYAGGFTLTPTSAASAMTAMGAQSFRNVNWINNSTAVGFFAGSRFNNVFRSVFVGENAGSTDIDTKVRNAKRVVAVGTSALYGTTGANNSHTDVISIGFESGLFSGLTKSILLGTYAGHRAAGTGGLVASNVIHIGHAESADLPISYGSNLSNVIVIGNDIVPVATNTIIFPTAYSMGIGTLNPQRKLHVEGDMRLTTLVSTPTKIIGVDAAGNVGEIAVGTNLTLTGGTLNASGGGGGSTFLSLSDTPANYTGAGGLLLRVNAGATAVEFVNGTSLFAAASHTHAAGDITSGTFADARIALSNVTQHQASLSIGWGQLTGVPSTFAPSAHTLDSHSNVTITSNTSGELLMWNGSAWINRTLAEAGIDSITLNQKRAVVTFKAIEATTISTGEKTATRVVVPYSGTIVGWYIVTDVNTTATFDIWKVNAGIPAGGNTITASAKPAITAASYASSTTLTGWTTSVSQGDVMVLEVEANSAATEVGLFLLIEKN